MLQKCKDTSNETNNTITRELITFSHHNLRSAMLKLKLKVTDCPNTSVAVIVTLWSTVLNRSMSRTSGKEQFSDSPPSNEQLTDTSVLVNPHTIISRPGTANLVQFTFRSTNVCVCVTLCLKHYTCVLTYRIVSNIGAV